jgi:hypothetical protein
VGLLVARHIEEKRLARNPLPASEHHGLQAAIFLRQQGDALLLDTDAVAAQRVLFCGRQLERAAGAKQDVRVQAVSARDISSARLPLP